MFIDPETERDPVIVCASVNKLPSLLDPVTNKRLEVKELLTRKLSAEEAVKAKEAVATDPNMFPATVKDPETIMLPESCIEPVKVEVPIDLKDPELIKDPLNSIRSPLNSKVSLATDRLPVRFIDPETPKDPVSSIRSPLNSKESPATESTFPELPDMACKDKDPLNTTDPEF